MKVLDATSVSEGRGRSMSGLLARWLATILVAGLVIFGVPLQSWAVESASQPSGAGTEDSPYQISSAEELLWMAEKVNAGQESEAHYQLTSDIDLASVASWDPIGNSSDNPFRGNFDGGGHVIRNMTINSAGQYVGLFGALAGSASLSEFGVVDALVVSDRDDALFIGIVVGAAGDGDLSRISSVYSTGSIEVTGNSTAGVGGIAGILPQRSALETAYSTAQIRAEGPQEVGGLVGMLTGSVKYGAALNPSISAGPGGRADRVVGRYYQASASLSNNVAFDGMLCTVTGGSCGDQSVPAAAGTGMTASQLNQVGNFPLGFVTAGWQMRDGALPGLAGKTVPMPAHLITSISGQGTSLSPFSISSGEQLAWVAQKVNNNESFGGGVEYSRAYYRLASDITLPRGNWTPIGTSAAYFRGVFDGSGHVVRGLTFDGAAPADLSAGLFGRVSGGTIRNIGVVDAQINVNSSSLLLAGVLAGVLTGQSQAENVYTSGSIIATGVSGQAVAVGGLVGQMHGNTSNVGPDEKTRLERAYSTASVASGNSGAYVGGIVGMQYNNNVVSRAAALNPSVEAPGGSEVGRVSGGVTPSAKVGFEGTQENNVGFAGTVVSVGEGPIAAESDKDGLDGLSVSELDVVTPAFWGDSDPERVTTNMGWDTANVWDSRVSELPVLRGGGQNGRPAGHLIRFPAGGEDLSLALDLSDTDCVGAEATAEGVRLGVQDSECSINISSSAYGYGWTYHTTSLELTPAQPVSPPNLSFSALNEFVFGLFGNGQDPTVSATTDHYGQAQLQIPAGFAGAFTLNGYQAENDMSTSLGFTVGSSETAVTAVVAPAGGEVAGDTISASVANSVDSVQVELGVSDGASWKLYSDEALTSEIASKILTLSVGDNTAWVQVTAEDGATTKTYKLVVTRATLSLSSDALVTGVVAPADGVVEGDTISASVAEGVGSVPVGLTVSDGASWKLYSDEALTSEIASKILTLSVGDNTAWVQVTAEDGTTTKTYKLVVTRAAPSLSSEALVTGVTGGGFADGGLQIGVAEAVASLQVELEVSAGATWKLYSDEALTSEIADRTLTLSVGANTAWVQVTAEDGVATNTYKLVVIRAAHDGPSSIALVTGVTGGGFADGGLQIGVAEAVASLLVELEVSDGASWKLYSDEALTSEIADRTLSLSVGANTAWVQVTAEDGTTTNTYKLVVTRAAPSLSSDAAVTGVAAPAGGVVEGDTISASVANSVDSVQVELGVSDGASWKLYSDEALTSEIADRTLSLSVGANAAWVQVTAEDGTTTNIYKLVVTRAGADDPEPGPVNPDDPKPGPVNPDDPKPGPVNPDEPTPGPVNPDDPKPGPVKPIPVPVEPDKRDDSKPEVRPIRVTEDSATLPVTGANLAIVGTALVLLGLGGAALAIRRRKGESAITTD